MSDSQPSRRSYLIIVIALLLAVGLFVALRSTTHEAVDIRTSPVTHENLVSQVSTNGKVEPIQQFQAHAPASGVVQQVLVTVGQKVKAGQLLIRMEDSDTLARLATARSSVSTAAAASNDLNSGGTTTERISNAGELSRAQIELQQATQSLAALKQLQTKGAASAAEVQSAQSRADTARAALDTARTRSTTRASTPDSDRARDQLADARASLSAAQSAYQHVNIRAPFAGTVYSVPVSDYDFVPGGEDLLDVADLTRMHVLAYFDEPEIGKLAAGQPVRIVWDAKPGRTWHGHIEVAPTTVITYGTRNVGECLITVDDADGELLPNTNVTVTVTYSQRFNVLGVPREALHTEGATNYVYKVVNHRLQRTNVGVGALNLTRVEITSGITEQDVIALNPANSNRDLTNGLVVRAVE